MTNILVLYYSVHGHVEEMARHVAHGVDKVEGTEARLRTVPTIASAAEQRGQPIPDTGLLMLRQQILNNVRV